MDNREEFLLNLYRIAWNNVNTHRDSLWKVLVPYLGFYVVLGDAYDVLGKMGVLLILMGMNTFVIAISINFNLWFVRNLGIATNIETYFLENSDYGKLIPEKYKEKIPFMMLEIWMFVVYCVSFVHVFIFALSFFVIDDCLHLVIISTAFLGSVFFILGWFFKHKRRFDGFKSEATGYHH